MPSSSLPYDVDDDDVTIIEETSVPSTTPCNQAPVKTIIFSQWTSMLDVLEFSLNEKTIEFRRLDGTMSLAARDRAVKEFSNDPDVSQSFQTFKLDFSYAFEYMLCSLLFITGKSDDNVFKSWKPWAEYGCCKSCHSS